MEHIRIAEQGRPGMIRNLGGLPASRSDWPEGAQRAFFDVLRQLDGWCRERNRPRVTNAAIAEHALRQVW